MRSFRVAAMAAFGAAFGLLAISATPVFAATVSGFATANVHQRSGPSTAYPPITVIPAGSSITIYGCLPDDSWCDVSWGPNRGWMSSLYLQVTYQSRRVSVRGYSGIPFITFNFGSYWSSNYRNRSFYSQRSKWSNFNWQGQGSGNPPPKPLKPPKNYTGQNDNNLPNFGSGKDYDKKFDHKSTGGQGYGSGQNNNNNNGGKNKNCVWKDGKLVCAPTNP